MGKINAYTATEHYQTRLSNGRREILADEPLELGGQDLGFAPEDLLCSALAACTNITLRMYADRKEWPLEAIHTDVEIVRNADNNTNTFIRKIKFDGPLDESQQQRLLQIAGLCPVHKILSGQLAIETTADF
ncbi:MAG: OsmC family protein [Chitinophagales bacterium]|nr:OsmC family protein [Chitinophagales bacterium]